jgi:hypothetical protein
MRLMITVRSVRGRGLVVLALVAVLGLVSTPAGAHAAETTTTTAPAVAISGGLSFRGAVITAPHKPARKLNAYQSAVFVQAWIGEAFYGKPAHEPVPANLTKYRVDVTGNWGGGADYFARPVFYASDGTKAWVVFPDPAKVPATGAPKTLDWFVAPQGVIAAFAGTAKLVPTVSETPTTTGAGASAPASKNDSGSGSVWPWIVGVAFVALIVGGLGWRRSRMQNT